VVVLEVDLHGRVVAVGQHAYPHLVVVDVGVRQDRLREVQHLGPVGAGDGLGGVQHDHDVHQGQAAVWGHTAQVQGK